MASGQNGSAVASTSRLSHPSLPAKPRLNGDFNQQDDFISFKDLLEDEEPSRGYRGKGKGREPRGQKRTIGEVLNEKGKRKLKDIEKTTPWTADVDWDSHASATQQLTAEIKAFTEYISPTDQEHELRSCVVESIRRLIVGRWRDAQVHAFGSFETRLYLPTGDIDLVIVSPSISREKNQQKRVLFQISGLLKSANIGTDIVVIAKARVPIVKFVTVQGGFKVDISLNMMNGIHVGKRVSQLFKEVGEEPARSLIMVTKAFLSQRNMNEVYSGGLGSYSIICLVVSFLQLHPKLQAKEIDPYDNLGTLLLEFLELYGKHFNFEEVGICVSSGGSYYSKSKRGWYRPGQPYLLSIEDPADPTNDVSGGSHNVRAVQMSLGGAYEVLSYAVYVRTSVIIARIAAAQSGRQLPTLSGRAILDPVGEGEGDIDECRKSLLGSIVGVTAEIEKSRNTARALAATGVVQRSVGVKPGTFDEKGQLDDPAARARRAARAAEAKQRAHAQAQAHLLMPTQLPQHLMNNKPPSAPASESGESHASSKRKARKTAQAQSAAAASRKEKPAALRKELEVVTSAQTTQPADEAKSNAKSITYINLDSDSEPDSAPIRTNASRSKVTRKDSDSSDSRYTVKKAAKVPPEPADAKYGANGIVDMDSSDSDSDVVLVTSRGQSDTKGSGKANNSGKSSGSSTPSKKESKKSRRKKRKAKQEAEAAAAAAAAASSDMDMSDSTSSREKAKRPTNSHPTPKRNKPTSPLRSTKLTNAQRKDYWNAKGHIADKHTVDSDSDSDTVHVRSK